MYLGLLEEGWGSQTFSNLAPHGLLVALKLCRLVIINPNPGMGVIWLSA